MLGQSPASNLGWVASGRTLSPSRLPRGVTAGFLVHAAKQAVCQKVGLWLGMCSTRGGSVQLPPPPGRRLGPIPGGFGHN